MKNIKSQRGFTLTELVVGLSILASLTLIISTILYSGFSFASKNSSDIYIGTELKKGYDILKNDIENSLHYSVIAEGKGLTLKTHSNEDVTYLFDSTTNTLEKNGTPIIKYVKDIKFSLNNPELLGIDVTFQQKDVEFTVPDTLYISTKK